MKEQIEEMAHIVCEMALKPDSCRECKGRKSGCFTIPKMKLLYDEGYRKQKEGEWVTKYVGNVATHVQCSNCGEYEGLRLQHINYCPNCGAKMKGGAE